MYRLTDAGRIEAHDWLTELIAAPVRDYPAFQAALAFLPALPPDDVLTLLRERAQHLESELAQAAAARELDHKQGVPRLFWVDAEFGALLRDAELGYVRTLIRDIESGALDGTAWWQAIHARADGEPGWPPPPVDSRPSGEGTP